MEVKIVKYDESYAAKVADMWNHSRDGWGGANTVDTEESVLYRERNSGNIHTFLALDGEKVVGYCGLSEYRDDEGALYIPLLNVRDDYHGKKIGKKLVLTALQETIHLKWPRLDLYTWPGNTKAVPLYKKCGFFWEERDDTTHLMNFMPTVLHTEAVKYFFQDVDWYECSTREIEVKPDGRVENEFHYYEYSWKKDDNNLRIEFERTGRGIRLIETDDYLISAQVDEHQLVFGNEYPIRYQFINKSGKPLHVALKGVDDKAISYSMEQSLEIHDKEEVIGTFYVNSIEEEQNSMRTHPTVKTIVHINGKEAIFKIGVLPKYPAQVQAHIPGELTFLGKDNVFYVDLMNNFRENIRYEMTFPSSPLLDTKENHYVLEMSSKERISIPVAFIANKHGFYQATLNMKAIKENGDQINFSKKIGIALRGIGAKFSGEDEESIQLFNGQYFASLSKSRSSIVVGRRRTDEDIVVMAPKLGKPYTEEIARAKPESSVYFDGTGFIGAKITYKLTAFPSINFHLIIKLYNEGLVEHYYEVENIRDTETEQPIWVNQSFFLGLNKAIIPYQGSLVEMKNSIGNYYDYWNDRNITENWIFINDDKNPHGICWNQEDRIHFDSWFNYFEHNLGIIAGKTVAKTNPVFLNIGAFRDVESFRNFAQQSSISQKENMVNHVAFSLKGNNPFVQSDKVEFYVKDFKANFLHGEVGVTLSGHEMKKEFNRDDKQSEWLMEIPSHEASQVSTMKVEAKLDAVVEEREILVIKTGEKLEKEIKKIADLDTWIINNGVLEFKATPDFFPTLHSLSYRGTEWLDSSFPILKPKSWWNPWAGGLTSRPDGIRPYSFTKEKATAAFANLVDNKGNNWHGIKLTTIIEKNDDYKGLTFHQYFLTLPSTPVLCHVTEIEQQTGKYFYEKAWLSTAFCKPGENMEENWINFQNKAGDWTKIVAGKDENDFFVERNMVVGCENQRELLHIIANSAKTARATYINKELLHIGVEERINVPSDTTFFTTPIFYLFSQQVISDQAQQDLQTIAFGNEEI